MASPGSPLSSRSPAAATVFGLLMVAATGARPPQPAFAGAVLAVAAVIVGIVARPVSTAAVAVTAGLIVLADAPPLLAALSGIFAVAYLLSRHSPSGMADLTSAPVQWALGFCAVGLVATSIPLALPWVGLLAPIAVLGLYLVAVGSFVWYVARPGDRREH